jgi:hypothetical protein
MPLRKIAKIVGAAMRDGDLARRTSASPKWREQQKQDRRGTLRKFETVEHALADREKSAQRAGAPSAAKKSKTKPTTKAKKK